MVLLLTLLSSAAADLALSDIPSPLRDQPRRSAARRFSKAAYADFAAQPPGVAAQLTQATAGGLLHWLSPYSAPSSAARLLSRGFRTEASRASISRD